MGCGSSKNKLNTVDDSVHRMLVHDAKVAKSKGEKPKTYVPRAPHPLLQPKSNDGDNNNNSRQPVTCSEDDL